MEPMVGLRYADGCLPLSLIPVGPASVVLAVNRRADAGLRLLAACCNQLFFRPHSRGARRSKPGANNASRFGLGPQHFLTGGDLEGEGQRIGGMESHIRNAPTAY